MASITFPATTTYGTFAISEQNPQKKLSEGFPQQNTLENEILEEQKKYLPKETVEGDLLPNNGLSVIRLDHDKVRGNFERILQTTDLDEKLRLFNDTIKMIAQHDVAEEVKTLLDYFIPTSNTIEMHIFESKISCARICHLTIERRTGIINSYFANGEVIAKVGNIFR